jgi:hypothetical protein
MEIEKCAGKCLFRMRGNARLGIGDGLKSEERLGQNPQIFLFPGHRRCHG